MKELIRKYRYVILVIFLLSVGLNAYLLTDSTKLEELNNRLEQANNRLNQGIKESWEKEQEYRGEIADKNKIIAALDKQLSEALRKYGILKRKFDTLPEPENPRTFQELEECQTKYSKLSANFGLSLKFGRETENSLKLCLDKSEKQQEIFNIQELAYRESQKQGRLKDLKLKNMEDAMKELDRYYKKRMFKKGLLKYAVGAVVGIAAGYFIARKR
ncbi:MAG: hypothetical protein GY950_21650 [bacterium]|nr:hypothetical protein [bacterium]